MFLIEPLYTSREGNVLEQYEEWISHQVSIKLLKQRLNLKRENFFKTNVNLFV